MTTVDEFLSAEMQAVCMLGSAGVQHRRDYIVALTFDLLGIIGDGDAVDAPNAARQLKRRIFPATLQSYLDATVPGYWFTLRFDKCQPPH